MQHGCNYLQELIFMRMNKSICSHHRVEESEWKLMGPWQKMIGNCASMLKRLALGLWLIFSGFKPGNLKLGESQPVLPSASLTSQCVSAGRFAPPFLAPPSLPCYLRLAWSHVIGSYSDGFSWITFAPCDRFTVGLSIFSFVCAGLDRNKTHLLKNSAIRTGRVKLLNAWWCSAQPYR